MSVSSHPSIAEDEYILPDQLAALSTRIDESPESLAAGNKDLQLAALQAAKYVFDLALQSESKSRAVIAELLGSMTPAMAPQTRSQAASSKAVVAQPPQVKVPELSDTPLPELVVNDMDKEQIWAQLELRAENVFNVLEFALESTGELADSDGDMGGSFATKGVNSLQEEDSDDEDMDFDSEDEDEDEDEDGDGDEDEDDTEEGDSDEEEEEEEDGAFEDSNDLEQQDEEVARLRDSDDEDAMDLDASGPSRPRGKRGSKGHPELDDGFFDLAAFNAQTEASEARNVSRGHLGEDEEEEEEELDLFATVDDTEEEGTKDLYYNDFFAPPSRRAIKTHGLQPSAGNSSTSKKGGVRFHEEVRVKSIKAKGKNLPVSTAFELVDEDDEEGFGEKMSDSESDEDEEVGPPLSDDDDGSDGDEGEEEEELMETESEEAASEGLDTHETIERLKNDLFADEDEEDEAVAGMSTHEKRMSALQEEIASLEAENVADKHWTLMGEASSRSRPQNALLEEDLDFERVMKSVPVITEEVVQSLEEIIKARILDNRFDDVVRKRPADDKPFLPSRLFELQDTKSKQSLAEIYEGEYLAAKTGGIAGEDRDGKLKKEHEELEKIWETLCGKMDALSNAHFTPKAPKAAISTVSNIASASLESALPTTKTTTTMLAPEEVFSASAADLRAKSEMTPAEKRALRSKQKKANRKVRDTLEKSVDHFARMKGQSVKKQKEAALKSVVKSGKGVTVIGKKSQDTAKSGRKSKS